MLRTALHLFVKDKPKFNVSFSKTKNDFWDQDLPEFLLVFLY